MPGKEKALQRYLQCQESLRTVLANIPEGDKATTTVEGDWTVKELLCHFIGWDLTLLEPLKIFMETGNFPVKVMHNHDAYNASQTASRKDLLLEEVVLESEKTSQVLLNLVSSLDENQCQAIFPAPWGGEGTIPAMLAGLAWHVDDHLKHVYAAFNLARGENS